MATPDPDPETLFDLPLRTLISTTRAKYTREDTTKFIHFINTDPAFFALVATHKRPTLSVLRHAAFSIRRLLAIFGFENLEMRTEDDRPVLPILREKVYNKLCRVWDDMEKNREVVEEMKVVRKSKKGGGGGSQLIAAPLANLAADNGTTGGTGGSMGNGGEVPFAANATNAVNAINAVNSIRSLHSVGNSSKAFQDNVGKHAHEMGDFMMTGVPDNAHHNTSNTHTNTMNPTLDPTPFTQNYSDSAYHYNIVTDPIHYYTNQAQAQAFTTPRDNTLASGYTLPINPSIKEMKAAISHIMREREKALNARIKLQKKFGGGDANFNAGYGRVEQLV